MMGRILTVLVVLAVIAGSLLLGRSRQTAAPTVADAGDAPGSGYAARDAEVVETGADGRPLYTLHADLIEQKPDEATVELERVEMDYRDANGNRWRARAEEGRILEDASRVELMGSVRVVGTPPGDYEDASIATERLTFDTQREIVTSREPVTLTWSGRELRARGLVADLKAQHVRLESDVHGSFTP
ncbi:MAG: LPS export ABC transporter periplasmic protein LptC [Gammaproteobacteria bacterium]